MKFAALSSGSCGNCFYIENNNQGIIIDNGISCKKVFERLADLGENPEKINSIFVSHEHSDHIKGVDVLARKTNAKIYATSSVIKNYFLCSNKELINEIKKDETLKINGLEIEAFSKSHDTENPISFKIKDKKTISVLTDIGSSCNNVIDSVKDSDFLVIESNHDLQMLEQGPYPYFLKKRIKSDKGHLSNLHSAICVLENANSKLKNIMLAHLSKTNNTPELALNTFKNLIKERSDLNPKIDVSLRDISTSLYSI